MSKLLTILGISFIVLIAFINLSSLTFVEAQNHPQKTNAAILLDSTNLGDKSYQPNPIELSVWSSVLWTNDDRISHSVTAIEGEFDSGIIRPDEVFEYTFGKAGGFDYYCMLHPSMTGRLVVH